MSDQKTEQKPDHEKRIREAVASGETFSDNDLRALLADLDAMRAKAARYDYLSERFVGADFDWNESGLQTLVFKVEHGTQVWATADKTIDGAIAALKGASHAPEHQDDEDDSDPWLSGDDMMGASG